MIWAHCLFAFTKGKAPVIGVHTEKETTHFLVHRKDRPSSFRERKALANAVHSDNAKLEHTHTHTHSHTFECRIEDPKGKAPVIGVPVEKETTHYLVNRKYRPSSFREPKAPVNAVHSANGKLEHIHTHIHTPLSVA